MRGHTGGIGSVDLVVRTLLDEFPELDAARVRAAVERAQAKLAHQSLDTEGYAVVDLHLERAAATEEAAERAKILRELSDTLDQRGDADRAIVVRLSAFALAPSVADLDPLLRLAAVTDRWSELPLDAMTALIDVYDDASARRLVATADAWQRVGRGYHAADCLERVLLIDPEHAHANEALELFYRANAEWPVLLDLLGRRTVHVAGDRERAELWREIAQVHARELADAAGALDAYREADKLEPDRPDVLEAMAKLTIEVGVPEGEALAVLERSARAIADPLTRARVLARAAELAKLENWDRAQSLFEAARASDPDLADAIDGFVPLLRDRGALADAIAQLEAGAARPALAAHRSRWLTDAGDLAVALGDTERAMELYLAARAADPANHRAAAAIVEVCWDTGRLAELAPLLDELCRVTDDPAKLREYLLARGKVAQQLGDKTGARVALARAVDLDPDDGGARRELAELLFEAGQWVKARPAIEAVLADEDLLPPGVAIELHYKLARTAQALGDAVAAARHADVALVLAPGHRAALLLRAELGTGDALTQLSDELALAGSAPPAERAARFAAIGDRYSELGDRRAAREMYREALVHAPGDHLLLTKFLELVTEDGDWSYALDVVARLIETETDARIRARYRHLGAMIAREELDDRELAASLLDAAVDDAPLDFAIADALEQTLADKDALARFLYRRLEHVRAEEGRAGERLRLWDRLGELSLELGRRDDALVAFEVAQTLAPDDLDRRVRLADLYAGADPKHDPLAAGHHRAILAASPKRVESYRALRALHARARRPHAVRALDDALAALGVHAPGGEVGDLFADASEPALPMRRTPKAPLRNEDWPLLARGVDRNLSLLFALAAPPFAVERARMRPPLAAPAREADPPPRTAAVLDRVIALLVTPRPPIYADASAAAPCKLAMRARAGVLAPVLVLGREALVGAIGDTELAFQLARQLADLRADRIARLVCPRAGELAQIVELAMQLADPGAGSAHAARWLASALHPVELEQARAIGAELRAQKAVPLTAAIGWLAATERAADRVGLVVTGDLAACLAIVERDGDAARAADLVAASASDEVLDVRAHVEQWTNLRASLNTRPGPTADPA